MTGAPLDPTVQPMFEAMNESELVVQQIAMEGAIHALGFLLQHQCHPLLAVQLFTQMREQLALAQEIAISKGFQPIATQPDARGMH